MTHRPVRRLGSRLLLLGTLATVTACDKAATPTSASDTTTTTTTTTTTADRVSEAFEGTVPVNGARFYSFEVATAGTVDLTLDRVGGITSVPASVWVGLGVGVPDGTDCPTTTSVNTQSGATAQISVSLSAGTFCARVYDIGNLAAAAPFGVTIVHP